MVKNKRKIILFTIAFNLIVIFLWSSNKKTLKEKN